MDPSVTSSDNVSSDSPPNVKPYFNEFEQKDLILKILEL